MSEFTLPTKDDVSEANRERFEGFENSIGVVPNIYAAMAASDVALEAYLDFTGKLGDGVLSGREVEAVNLVASQVNGCEYCLAAHTSLAKQQGFSERETIELRDGSIGDRRLNALVTFTREATEQRGGVSDGTVKLFRDAGYGQDAMVEVLGIVASKFFTNMLHRAADYEVDFPAAPALESEPVV